MINLSYKRTSNGSESAINSRKKWDDENIKRVSLALSLNTYNIAKAIAEHEGKSFNRFVTDCIESYISGIAK